MVLMESENIKVEDIIIRRDRRNYVLISTDDPVFCPPRLSRTPLPIPFLESGLALFLVT